MSGDFSPKLPWLTWNRKRRKKKRKRANERIVELGRAHAKVAPRMLLFSATARVAVAYAMNRIADLPLFLGVQFP
jgi:hypothetical protein